jgi:nitroimidazol reductase NimA-like FMN-containing flavoprotein (pyridoxamine 5'-phosphate oxidase superfamily)
MLIHEMTRQASIDLLARVRLCRLACVREGQPYIVPIHYAYEDNYLYSFTTLGQKIAWMRDNPLVCVEADELTSQQDWATVIVSGRYEELADTPEFEGHRELAHDLLKSRPMWWEPGYVKTVLADKTRPLECIYFRIRIESISGHRGIPDGGSSQVPVAEEPPAPAGWLRKMFRRS